MKLSMKQVALALFGLAMAGAAQATSVNLVQNGDFESGVQSDGITPVDWTQTGNWLTNYGRVSGVVNGTQGLWLGNYPYQGALGVSQQISTTAGQTYSFSVDWHDTDAPTSAGSLLFEVLWDGQSHQITIPTTLDSYFQTWTFTVIGSGSDTLVLQAYTPTSWLYADNVSLTEVSPVPLPGAALLFGTAVLGTGAWRRRGRKAGVASA